jgi:hypothetical protein
MPTLSQTDKLVYVIYAQNLYKLNNFIYKLIIYLSELELAQGLQ